MRANEFITEAKLVDYEGITLKITKNDYELMVDALDDWGNNVLGHVTFYLGDDNELDPQDLWVNEKYQGQGIARVMYDYIKKLGYKIVRSYDQTDAGAGFWDKHRGDVRVWEAFDKPYKGKWEKSEYGDVDLNTKLPDGTYLNIMFNNQQDDEGEEVVQVEFYRNNSQEVTGEGDAQRIFATVLNAIQKYIKKYKPSKLSFSASKATDPTIYYEPDQPQPNPESRAKLYTRLVQRYAAAWGYQAQHSDEGDVVIYQLTRARGVAEARGLAPTKPYDDLMANMGYFMSLNTVKIQQDAVDSNAQQELANMQKQFRQPIMNGMSFFDVNRDIKISKNPKVAPILLKYVYDMIGYIEPRIKKYIKPDQQGKYLDRLNQIKNDYRAAVAQVS
jgi:GNAT superfamily N-acetyltransferase